MNIPRICSTRISSLHVLQKSCIYYSPLFQQRTHLSKYGSRSFLSDEHGVKTFVNLLGVTEQKMLLNELNQRMNAENPANSSPKDAPPTVQQLKLTFIHQALPFVGFGFLDNLIMIVAGDYIDANIGLTLGISTMAAAGLGNALSDVAGIGSAWLA